MTDFERNILRSMNGDDVPWGAAMGVALGFLKAEGYVVLAREGDGMAYTLTEKGKVAANG